MSTKMWPVPLSVPPNATSAVASRSISVPARTAMWPAPVMPVRSSPKPPRSSVPPAGTSTTCGFNAAGPPMRSVPGARPSAPKTTDAKSVPLAPISTVPPPPKRSAD